jgi:hypothetical protein
LKAGLALHLGDEPAGQGLGSFGFRHRFPPLALNS